MPFVFFVGKFFLRFLSGGKTGNLTSAFCSGPLAILLPRPVHDLIHSHIYLDESDTYLDASDTKIFSSEAYRSRSEMCLRGLDTRLSHSEMGPNGISWRLSDLEMCLGDLEMYLRTSS